LEHKLSENAELLEVEVPMREGANPVVRLFANNRYSWTFACLDPQFAGWSAAILFAFVTALPVSFLVAIPAIAVWQLWSVHRTLAWVDVGMTIALLLLLVRLFLHLCSAKAFMRTWHAAIPGSAPPRF
jgi:hypothetical protein